MRRLRVLVGCEFSGIVREAFRRRGHDAWSCDLLDTEIPGQHYKGDVREMLKEYWDIFIVHPECKYMANSGAKHLYIGKKKSNGIDQVRWENMVGAAHFFKDMYNAPVKSVAAENPIMLSYARDIIGTSHSQVIQPYWFGHPESKATCLWLRNLPPLVPTNKLDKPASGHWENQTASGQNKLAPSPDRWKNRSRTYSGIADAMAEQWSAYLLQGVLHE